MISLIIPAVRVYCATEFIHDLQYVLAPVFASTINISIISIRYNFQIIFSIHIDAAIIPYSID